VICQRRCPYVVSRVGFTINHRLLTSPNMEPPSAHFSNLAIEVLDHIIYLIYAPSDLLSLALCERRLADIIIPSHIQFRHLACNIWLPSIFSTLLEHPILCSRFVSLDMSAGRYSEYIWPLSLLTTLDRMPLIADDWKVNSLSKTASISLRDFVGLTSFRCKVRDLGMDHIFKAVQESCSNLSTLELLCYIYQRGVTLPTCTVSGHSATRLASDPHLYSNSGTSPISRSSHGRSTQEVNVSSVRTSYLIC
jgi:hypothetical protein